MTSLIASHMCAPSPGGCTNVKGDREPVQLNPEEIAARQSWGVMLRSAVGEPRGGGGRDFRFSPPGLSQRRSIRKHFQVPPVAMLASMQSLQRPGLPSALPARPASLRARPANSPAVRCQAQPGNDRQIEAPARGERLGVWLTGIAATCMVSVPLALACGAAALSAQPELITGRMLGCASPGAARQPGCSRHSC